VDITLSIIEIIVANESDASTIARLGRELFVQTFGHLYEADDLAMFLTEMHHVDRVASDMAKGDVYLVATDDGRPIGYAKCGKLTLPVSTFTSSPFEIKQLYIDAAYHGSGLAQKMISMIFADCHANGFDSLYLGVWSENYKAQRFYEKFGFKPIACYWYRVGTKLDREVIMRRITD
jgi:ribosomal protein S18 acetylase RimI-like enzyme